MSFDKLVAATKSLSDAIGGKDASPKDVFTALKSAALDVKAASSELGAAFSKKDFARVEQSAEKIIDILENKTIQQKDFVALISSVGKVSLCIIKLVMDGIACNIPGVITDVIALIPALKEAYINTVSAVGKFTEFCKTTILPALKDFGVQIHDKLIKPIQEKIIEPIKALFINKAPQDIKAEDIQKMHSIIDLKLKELFDDFADDDFWYEGDASYEFIESYAPTFGVEIVDYVEEIIPSICVENALHASEVGVINDSLVF